MTKDEIFKMEAGREMDALIAEKVMGLTLWYGDPTGFGISENMTYWRTDIKDTEGEYCLTVPRYSTDIAAAWEVVEKIDLLGNYELSNYGGNEGYVLETSGEYGLDEPSIYANAPTAPLAICRAALLAILEE